MFYIWIYFKILQKKFAAIISVFYGKNVIAFFLQSCNSEKKKAELHNNCDIIILRYEVAIAKKKKKLVSAMDQKSYWVYISQFRSLSHNSEFQFCIS